MDENKRKHIRNDLILVIVVAALAIGYFVWRALLPSASSGEVVVEVYGREYARLPLNEDAELAIVYEDNYNYLVIRDGVATVTEASCPDGLCVHQSDISKEGEMIVCLPNQVLVIVENGEDSGLDGLAK